MFDSTGFEVGVGVNPYPNENNQLSLIQIEGDKTVNKVPVKNQYVVTNSKITNLSSTYYDQSIYEEVTVDESGRITGVVLHPSEDIVVEGAEAILVTATNLDQMKTNTGDDTLAPGQIVFKMPKGALEDENSIFNDDKFKGLQNLRAKFFARPRTKAEFEKLANGLKAYDGDESFGYVSTGAGEATINHNGEEVTIDKQGIARYDHYNLVGEMTINLDDTKYYDQNFKGSDGKDTQAHTSSKVKPGESFKVEMYVPEGDAAKDNQKTADEMNKAKTDGEAIGEVNFDFVEAENKKIADKLGTTVEKLNDDQKWKVDFNEGDISKFTITPPTTAKPGDFVAVPVEYTYTNGSTDIHWFHFVVQDTNYNKPEYFAKVGYKGTTLKSNPVLPKEESDKMKEQPKSYKLVDGATYTDNKGNVWSDVKVDPNTGEVSATVPDDAEIVGGEELYVPVEVKYYDPIDKKEITKTVKAQFIARTPKVDNAEVIHESDTKIPFKSKEVFDETLPLGTIKVVEEGKAGEGKVQFKQHVVNGVKGLINDEGTFIPGDDKFFVDTKEITAPVDRLVKVGVKPVEEKVIVPKTVEYIVDKSLKPGDEVVLEQGNDGEITVKTSKNKETGAIEITKTETTAMKPMKVKIGAYEHENDLPFETTVEFDDTLAAGEKTEEGGVVGKTKTKVTPAQVIDLEKMNDYLWELGQTVGFEEGSGAPNLDKVFDFLEKNYGWDRELLVVEEVGDGSKTYTYNGKDLKDYFQGEDGYSTLPDAKNESTGKQLIPGRVETKEITPKKDKVIKVGTKTEGTVVDEDEIPFDYTVEFDPDFYTNYPDAENNYVIVKKGTPGKNKKTWKIVNSQIVGKPTVEKTDPENGIVKVGQKDFTGTFKTVDKDPIPFETKYQIDPTMKPTDEPVVVKQGELGEKETTTTHTIKNGEITKSDKGEAKQTKAPKEQIVKIGAKTDGVYTYTEKLPFKVEVTYDPSLKSGEYVVDQEGEPGEIKKTLVIENSEVKGNPIVGTKNEKDPVNAKIRVGSKDFTGEVTHTEKHEVPFEVEVIYDDTLDVGTTIKEKDGKKGSYDLTYKQNIKNGAADGKATTEKSNEVVAENAVIRVGTKKVVEEVEIPHDTVYKVNKDLKPGETKETTKGVNGKKTIEFTFDKETGKPVRKESTEAATNKVVEIGPAVTNGTHTVTEEIPFDVNVEYDPNMEAGKYEIVTPGQVGTKETTLTIENSEVKGEPKSKVTKDPVTQVIKVGNKDFTGEIKHENTCKIPFETEVIYDENLDAGTRVVESEGKPGSKTTETIYKIKNGQKDGDPTSNVTSETKATNRKVRIGIKPITKEVEIPHDTEYEVDSTLKSGEIEEVTPGKNGKKTITTKFDKDAGKLVVSEEDTQPTNRKVKVGAKTDGTYKYKEKVPFKVIVKEDPKLEAGKSREEGGEVGEKEVTVTIENSKVVGDPVEKETKKAVDKIIYVGTKPNKDMCPVPGDPEDPNPEKPGEEDPSDSGKEDPTKPGKEDPTEPGKDDPSEPGKNDPTKPGKDDPSKPGEDEPSEPGKDDPAKPGKEDPTKPGKDDPTEPGKDDPSDPGKDDPSKPGKDKPSEPGKDDPSKPGKEDPSKPGKDEPSEPGKDEPSEPGKEDPTKPGKEDPTKPGKDEPSEPGKDDPVKPGEDEPSDPAKDKPSKEDGKEPSKDHEADKKDLQKDKNEDGPKLIKDVHASEELGKEKNIDDKLTIKVPKTEKSNPKTGVGSVAGSLGALGASLAGLFATRKKKEK